MTLKWNMIRMNTIQYFWLFRHKFVSQIPNNYYYCCQVYSILSIVIHFHFEIIDLQLEEQLHYFKN